MQLHFRVNIFSPVKNGDIDQFAEHCMVKVCGRHRISLTVNGHVYTEDVSELVYSGCPGIVILLLLTIVTAMFALFLSKSIDRISVFSV